MKILLDECVTKKIKTLLPEHKVFTIGQMGWAGLKNGKLLTKAVENKFDILLTIDKNINYQQNISKYNISLIVLNVNDSNIETIADFIPNFNAQIKKIEKGRTYLIEK